MAFSPDGQSIAVGSYGGSISLWNVSTGQLRATLQGHRSWVSSLAFSPEGRVLASASGDKTAKLWNTQSGKLLASFDGRRSSFLKLSLSADGRMLATASDEDQSPRLWDTQTGGLLQILPRIRELYSVRIGDLEFSPTEPLLAITSYTSVYLWDAQTGKLRFSLDDKDLSRIATVLENRRFIERQETRSHVDTIYRILFSHDGRLLATGGRDTTAKLWETSTGKLTATLKHDGKVVALAFSPDGEILATGSGDFSARLWSARTSALLATLPHNGTVWSLSFSPDMKLLATGSDNEKAVKIWEVATGKLIETLPGARYGVAFSPDGRTLATAKWERPGTVFLWDVPTRLEVLSK
jgi:WD40 repeat protein